MIRSGLDVIRRDLRDAVRALRRTPGFTLTAILILALGIGMASAMFTVFERVLLRRLPVEDQDQVVELSGVGRGAATEYPLLIEQFRRYRSSTRTLSGVAGFAHWRTHATGIMDGDRPLSLRESLVTDNFFSVLGAHPAAGRSFSPQDPRVDWGGDTNQRSTVIVLSYDTWQRSFAGDPSIIGHHLRDLQLGWDMTVVGVAPPGLDYPRGVEYWVNVYYSGLDVVGRLARGSTMEGARAEFENFFVHDPDTIKYQGEQAFGAQVHSLADMILGDVRPALVALSAAVGLLLLLACVNTGNLLLLRAAGRTREMAVRRAVGAGTSDLIRPLLAESVLIAVAGGIAGVVVAQALIKGLLWLAPTALPRSDLLALSGLPLATASIVTGLTVVLFAVVPVLGTVRFDLSTPLRADTRSGTEGRRLRKIRQALVASQVALALMVLAGAGLLGRSFARLANLELGYTTDHLSVLTASVPFKEWAAQCRPPGQILTPQDSARWGGCYEQANFNFHDQFVAELEKTAGATGASSVAAPPFLGSNVWLTRVVPEGALETDAARSPWFGLDLVGPEYFRTLDLPILRGRGFTDGDREGTARVAVISEGVARALWPGQDVIGKRFHFPQQGSPDSLLTIVGLTRDLHFREYRESTPMVFRPFRQSFAQGYFVARTHARLADELPAIRQALRNADPRSTLVAAATLDELIAPDLERPRFNAFLLALFAVAALVLAAIGLYGIMASAVAQQTRELGVRMALGATAQQVRGMILRQALLIAALGGACGLVGAGAGARLLASLLFEVRPADPVTLVGVVLLLLAVALLAAYLPARRATRIDPAVALRAE